MRLYVFHVLCQVIHSVASCGVSCVQAIISGREDKTYKGSSIPVWLVTSAA